MVVRWILVVAAAVLAGIVLGAVLMLTIVVVNSRKAPETEEDTASNE